MPLRAVAAAGAAVMLLTLVVFSPALSNSFVNLDDEMYVIRNSAITSLDPAMLKWAFTTFYAYNYHPLTWISYAFDYRLWGLDPFGYHLSSLLLHGINAFLVVFLSYRLIMAASPDAAQTSRLRLLLASALTGLVFGLHPLRVESVAWVSERKDLLCGLFYLLSLLSYVSYASGRSGRPALWYGLSLVSFALACLSKPMAISLPVVLLLLDVCPLRRLERAKALQLAAEKVPFALISVVLGILTIVAQRTSGQIRALTELSLGERGIAAMRELSFYIEKLFVPTGLAPFYPLVSPVSFTTGDMVRAVCLIGFTALCWFLWRKNRAWMAAWVFYVVTAVPTLGIIQVGGQAGADRYTYLPLLGPSILMAGVISLVIERLWSGAALRRVLAAAALIVCLVAVTAMSLATRDQIGVWRDSISLWSREIAMYPFNVAISYQNRAMAYAEAGEHALAVRDYSTAVLMEPDDYRSLSGRGVSRLALGDVTSACADFEGALRIQPGYYQAIHYQSKACR